MDARRPAVGGVILVLLCCAPEAAAGRQPQQPRMRPGGGAQMGRMAAGEIQRLFDAYQVMQSQEALQLDETQFAQFLPKLTALQQARRRNEYDRQQLVQALAQLLAPGQAMDEARVKDTLRALQELDGRAAAELRRAYDALDQTLDFRQQARFRVFESQMERRKLELLLRVRRAEPGRDPQIRVP
jgi:hypothetical protein